MIPHFGLDRQYAQVKDELLAVTDQVLQSGQFVDGYFTTRFEGWLQHRTNCQHASLVHSGTQALELIAAYEFALYDINDDVKPTVKIPNLTYPATLNAFWSTGWNVELVDTDKNGIISLDDDTTDYVCFVGLYGANPSINYTDVIVDGAQHWLACDSNLGLGTAISFDPTKNLCATGNGGAIVTNDPFLHEFVKQYRNNGKPKYELSGTNSKMSEIDCAHLLVRSNYIDSWQSRRRMIRCYYLDEFENLPIRCLSRGFNSHADQKFVIYTDQRNELKHYLEQAGIEVRIHYPYALSELKVASDIKVKPDLLSTSVMLSRGVLSLPIYPELTDAEVEYIATKVKDFFNGNK